MSCDYFLTTETVFFFESKNIFIDSRILQDIMVMMSCLGMCVCWNKQFYNKYLNGCYTQLHPRANIILTALFRRGGRGCGVFSLQKVLPLQLIWTGILEIIFRTSYILIYDIITYFDVRPRGVFGFCNRTRRYRSETSQKCGGFSKNKQFTHYF